MLELLSKKDITKEELEKLDHYLEENVGAMIIMLDNQEIIRIINKTKEELVFSFFEHSIEQYLAEESLVASILISEDIISKYIKYIELSKLLNLDYSDFIRAIGDCYCYEVKNEEEAIKFYQEAFTEGFNLCKTGYYDSLERYLELLKQNPVEKLEKLINASPRDNEYSNDFVNTYLLLIVNLEKEDDRYLKYINDAIKVATPVVREIQKYTTNRESFSDTDEERNLCELLTLKLEHYVNKKEYKMAFDVYNELTEEIAKSDCTRYYHARSLYYRQMIEYMSEEYEEVKFLNDIGYAKFEIVDEIGDINNFLNKEITLKRESGQTLKFVVKDIYKNDVVIAPVLPLIGLGGNIYTRLEKEDNKLYLINSLSK